VCTYFHFYLIHSLLPCSPKERLPIWKEPPDQSQGKTRERWKTKQLVHSLFLFHSVDSMISISKTGQTYFTSEKGFSQSTKSIFLWKWNSSQVLSLLYTIFNSQTHTMYFARNILIYTCLYVYVWHSSLGLYINVYRSIFSTASKKATFSTRECLPLHLLSQ